MKTRKELISFVIPCYGSENTVQFVIEEIIGEMKEKQQYDYEIIAVNDCSPDKVWDVLLALSNSNNRIKLINLSKNMNRPGAVMAGLNYSSGDYVCIMDDDGQCPMKMFWTLFAPLTKGSDVSIADYPERKQTAFKDFGTFVNKKMTEYMLDRPKDVQFTNFMILKRYIVKEMCKYNNPYPYLTGLILRVTRNITCVKLEERERYRGKTNFTFSKMVSLWFNGLTAFSIKPLRLSSFLGILIASVGFVYGIVIIIRKMLNNDIVAGYSSLMAALLFTSGVIMILLGFIGEYLGRIYMCINNAPQYVVKETINFE